jgi:hypothetical protein
MYCPNPECPDLVQSGVRGEYVDEVTVCPACGSYLVATIEEADSQIRAQRGAGEPEPVFVTEVPSEIPIIKSILDGAGIPYSAEGEEHFDAFRGSLSPLRFNPLSGSVTFYVLADLAEEARALLTELDEEEQSSSLLTEE